MLVSNSSHFNWFSILFWVVTCQSSLKVAARWLEPEPVTCWLWLWFECVSCGACCSMLSHWPKVSKYRNLLFLYCVLHLLIITSISFTLTIRASLAVFWRQFYAIKHSHGDSLFWLLFSDENCFAPELNEHYPGLYKACYVVISGRVAAPFSIFTTF